MILDEQTGRITGYALFATGALQVISALVRDPHEPILSNLLLVGFLLFVVGACLGGVAVESGARLLGFTLAVAGLVAGMLVMALHDRWASD
jgi:hypothetical protein